MSNVSEAVTASHRLTKGTALYYFPVAIIFFDNLP